MNTAQRPSQEVTIAQHSSTSAYWYVKLPYTLYTAQYKCSFRMIHLARMQNRKIKILCPLIRTRMCLYQRIKDVSFSVKFAYLLNERCFLGKDFL